MHRALKVLKELGVSVKGQYYKKNCSSYVSRKTCITFEEKLLIDHPHEIRPMQEINR